MTLPHPSLPHALAAVLSLCLVACDPVDAELDPARAVLVLPVVPVDSLTMTPVLQGERIDDRLERMSASRPMTLALGDAYPERVQLLPDRLWHTRCFELDGSWAVEVATSSEQGVVTVEIDEAGSAWLQLLDEGSSVVHLSGAYAPTDAERCPDYFVDGTRYEVHVEYEVEVVRPSESGLRVPRLCTGASALRTVAGAPLLADAHVFAADARGEPLWLENAAPARQVELRVTAPEGGVVVPPGSDELGLGELVFTGAPGIATVEPMVGETLEIEVVEPGVISSIGAQFVVPWGSGRTDLEVLDGGRYGELGWSFDEVIVEPRVGVALVDGEPTCSRPLSQWFELRSATPETCAVSARSIEDEAHWDVFPIEPFAEVVADGECSLTLAAGVFRAGQGYEIGVTASFENTQR